MKLTDPGLRADNSNTTVLHSALEKKCWSVGKYLIESCEETFLANSYNITIGNIPSHKSCLHILTEKGNYELTVLFLERFKNETTKKAVLEEMLLVELRGHKLRQMASIHIAALKGYTDIIDLFVQLGVDVNMTTDRNETAVMWAVRGNHLKTVRRFMKLGAKLRVENDEGATPFYWAVRYGFSEIVRELLVEGNVSVNQTRKVGLASPIVLASALGYMDIVEILLDNGADANTKIKSTEQTALHFASAEGNIAIVSALIKKGRADINHYDSNGNTALLFAAKARNVSTMRVLIDAGAFIDCKNKMNESIWDFAMQGPENDFLDAVVELYKKAKHINDPVTEQTIIVFPVGRSPLHVAAMNGDVAKITRLTELGVNPKALDLNGNTYFHVAALHDCHNVLSKFMNEVDIEHGNASGNTALHIAARNGNINSVRFLLPKSNRDARNKLGMTPLHEVVDSDLVNPSVIRLIVEFLVSNNDFSLLNARDVRDNTALHIAAQRGRTEIFQELTLLDPMLSNTDGDTPFHLAARNRTPHCLENMFTALNRPEKRFNIDKRNAAGETVLHECARMGDAHRIELLVLCGADLALQNNKGNSVMHILVEELATAPTQKEAITLVYRAITLNAIKWWCLKDNLPYPSEPSERYNELLRSAMLHLTEEVYNKNEMNVISFATSSCVVDLLYEIFNTNNVYRFKKNFDYNYDISNLTPQTMITSQWMSLNFQNLFHTVPNLGSIADAAKSITQVPHVHRNTEACLDIVLSMKNEATAGMMLDIVPLKTLVRDYWNTYQWLYSIFICIHIAYMILYSVFVIPTYAQLQAFHNSTHVSPCRVYPSTGLFGLFLIWPAVIIFFEIYPVLSEVIKNVCGCYRCFRSGKDLESDISNVDSTNEVSFICRLPYLIVRTLFYYLSYVTSILFGASIITWFVLFMCSTNQRAYVEIVSSVLIFGWFFTMSLTNGFKDLHMFTIMLKSIIIRDIGRFLLIYVFILMGCGLAFHALFQVSRTMSIEYSTVWLTLYNTINLMMGLGSLWDNTFDDLYAGEGGDPGFVKAVYILYILLANIILMSLLIAMMTDTYTEVKFQKEIAWRVGSLRLALRVEKSMPCLRRILRAVRLVHDRVTFDKNRNRWFMSVSLKEVDDITTIATDPNDMSQYMQRLERKLDELSLRMEPRSPSAKVEGGGDATVTETAMVANISDRTRFRRLQRNSL